MAPPTTTPPVFHVSTRHSARRQNADKEAKRQEGLDHQATSPLNVATGGVSDESSAPENQRDAAPTKASKRARVSGEENEDGEGKHPPIRKASMNSTRVDLILGKYLVGDANIMCMEILQQMNDNAESSRAMAASRPPVSINWLEVSANLQYKHHLHLKPRECQDLWKYLAYDHPPSVGTDLSAPDLPVVEDQVAADSDVEDFNATAEFLAEKRTRTIHKAAESAADPSRSTVQDGTTAPEDNPSTTPASVGDPSELGLFPSFDPSGFLHSDAELDMSTYVPLHAVAEQFMRRREPPLSLPHKLPQQYHPPIRMQQASAAGAGAKPTTPQSSSNSSMVRAPPPQPTPSTSPFDIFKRMYTDRSGLDDMSLNMLFEQSPLEVRTRCHQLAAQDLERYQKECLRQRLYEKSVRGLHTPPNTPPRANAVVRSDIM
ncbi:hypothetical protein, variant [Aphanomyces astaci]|uniref:Uncharacterized protein n=1 Tax=Aphanomyces astaci TaxID=112090 RepID=W4FL57_APHAT|nr:hypothetical protein, variant [Aphanomyces astaci]ETV67448.1 hypothetical protein, variant [Aphanomyces astaci]|eukprot:XP_009843007.1 hypothetical protein, variant [Aphanomyces astaci]